jgi:hypothetical protein
MSLLPVVLLLKRVTRVSIRKSGESGKRNKVVYGLLILYLPMSLALVPIS